MARCSALMTGDHQRDSHSAGRSISWPAYLGRRLSFAPYQNGRSQPAVSKKTASSSRSRSYTGLTRTGRPDSHCSAGCTMPYILLKASRARPRTCSTVRW